VDLAEFQVAYSTLKNTIETQKHTIKHNKTVLKECEQQKLDLIKAVGLIDRAIQIISANGVGKIESVVSDGLKLVFGQDIRLVIDRKEGTRGDSYQLIAQKGEVRGAPLDTIGGGPVNVMSFLLRVLMIQRFKLKKFLALDESFVNVSAEFLPKVSEMIRTLCDQYGFGILSVTHQPMLAAAADRVFLVEKGPLLRELRPEELDEYRAFNQNQDEVRTGDSATPEGSPSSPPKKIHKKSSKGAGAKLQAQEME
jgi:DNA repair exonuclease SbcCD ATPase subunit